MSFLLTDEKLALMPVIEYNVTNAKHQCRQIGAHDSRSFFQKWGQVTLGLFLL
jgi:hypothetical protein